MPCTQDLLCIKSYNPYYSVKSVQNYCHFADRNWGPGRPHSSWRVEPGSNPGLPDLTQDLGSALPLSDAHTCGGRSSWWTFQRHYGIFSHWTDWSYCHGHIASYGCCPVYRSGMCLNFLIYAMEIRAEPISMVVGRNEWAPAGAGIMVHTVYVLSFHSYHYHDQNFIWPYLVFPHMPPARDWPYFEVCGLYHVRTCLELGWRWGSTWELNRGGRPLTLLLWNGNNGFWWNLHALYGVCTL